MERLLLAFGLALAACDSPHAMDETNGAPLTYESHQGEGSVAEELSQHADLVRDMVARGGGDPDQELTPAEPFDIYLVHANELAASPDSLAPLLHETGRRLYPLLDRSGAVVCSVTLARSEAGWKTVRVGEKSVAVALHQARSRLGARDARLVRIPGVALELMASGGSLTPLFDHESLGLRANQTRPERELLVHLVSGAQKALERE